VGARRRTVAVHRDGAAGEVRIGRARALPHRHGAHHDRRRACRDRDSPSRYRVTLMTPRETGFTMDTSAIKFGPGMTREVGYEVARLGCRRVMVVTDPRLARLPPVQVAM